MCYSLELLMKLLYLQFIACFLRACVKFGLADTVLEEVLVDPGYVAYWWTLFVNLTQVIFGKELA